MYLIVGIDPGIKTGYALLDLRGRLVGCGSLKEASDEEIIRLISGVGVPVLVASDTSPPSSFTEKVAARLNIRVFHPKESMKKAEKKEIGAVIEDVHARDAYAAAVKAFRRYQNRLRQIDAREGGDELKKMVITGQKIGGLL